MTDDLAHKLQIAADMIHDEMHRRGTHVSPADCLAIARRLHDIWRDRVEILHLEPGEVARRFRERYERDASRDWADRGFTATDRAKGRATTAQNPKVASSLAP